MCRENEGSDTVFRQYRMGAIDKAVDDRHAERRVAKNDGYVLLRQLDASEVSDDDLSAGIGFGDSADIGIHIYTIGPQKLRACAKGAAGATGRIDHTTLPEPNEHVDCEHFSPQQGRDTTEHINRKRDEEGKGV